MFVYCFDGFCYDIIGSAYGHGVNKKGVYKIYAGGTVKGSEISTIALRIPICRIMVLLAVMGL